MPILYRTLTMDRMWTLLEAHTPFTDIISSVRRVKDTQEGWLKKMVLRGVGDFPHVRIVMGDRFGGGPVPATTFASEVGTFGSGASDEWDEERTSDFKLQFIYENENFPAADELEMTAIEALEEAGRNLGLEVTSNVFPIIDWGPWTGNRSGTALIAETVRPITQIVIPVKYQFTGAQLKP